YNMQTIGESIVSSNLAANTWRDKRGVLSSGLVAVQPTTGDILAMVGSPSYNSTGGQINFTTIPRNMGSSMKPYTYGAVINARAATVDTPVYDGPSPLVYKDAYSTTKIYNYDGKSHGVLPLKKAMGNSLNIAAVKVELSIGVPAVLSWMRNLNVRPRYVIANPDGSFAGYDANAPADEYGPSLTLGGYPITLPQHVDGIATYAVTVAFTPDLAAGLWVGDILGNSYAMVGGSDGVFVASPGVHSFVSQALAGVDGSRWYTPPPGVVAGPGNSWYLADTTRVDKL